MNSLSCLVYASDISRIWTCIGFCGHARNCQTTRPRFLLMSNISRVGRTVMLTLKPNIISMRLDMMFADYCNQSFVAMIAGIWLSLHSLNKIICHECLQIFDQMWLNELYFWRIFITHGLGLNHRMRNN